MPDKRALWTICTRTAQAVPVKIEKIRTSRMKTFYTCLLFFCIAATCWGQERKPVARVETRMVGIVPVHRILIKEKIDQGPLARVYRRPNARVKKALSCSTKAQRPKIA